MLYPDRLVSSLGKTLLFSNDGAFVYLIPDLPMILGNICSFNEFPLTPGGAPTSDYQVPNKKYVDDQITAATAAALEDHYRWTAMGWYQVGTTVDGAWVPDVALTVTGVWIWRGTAGTSSATIVDLNKNGTTMYTTQANRPTIAWNDADKKVDCTLPDVVSIAAGDIVTIDIDQKEGGTPQDLIVCVYAT